MDRIRMGVIGLGFGQHHVRTLVNMPEAELTAVADRNPRPDLPGGLQGFAARYGAAAYHDGHLTRKAKPSFVSHATSPYLLTPASASTYPSRRSSITPRSPSIAPPYRAPPGARQAARPGHPKS